MTRKKKIIAAALVIWILGAVYLASKTLDEFRDVKQPGGVEDTLSLKNIFFPSLRDQE